MPPGELWTIGELAGRAGVTVKTVRFYSDQGLLPAAHRSTGGHRRYGPGALDRLRTIRSLRALGLGVADVARVLREDDDTGCGPDGLPAGGALEDAVAGRLREVGSRLAALRWQQTALRLLHDCDPGERAERLRLLGAVCATDAPPSTAAMARFWRRWLPPRMPAPVTARVVDLAVPHPPDDPTPEQALAFARLHAFVSGDCTGRSGSGQPAAHRAGAGHRHAVLYQGLEEAYDLAAPHLRAGRAPCPGDALDCFVAAYAASQRVADTGAFRRGLHATLAADPRIDHYWDLVARVTGPAHPTPGAAHAWLTAALV
ncbi:putative MerR family transcriptional regulator [Actinacidiphila reveromycinica]|uniref:Putative MerR family transcriptional regulator n=1 Tax=Actinacidiphila reveromycinica TaxID=659352 RepID=A0A7U3V0E9_9ACTN|nr:MerR family transcriptional regulator [Streptomyces sp. SN-593]BBB02162.1 putative MerR family transcriptional regulator [Streptomyces sp. SN-593]